jgi:hypothetical protein
MQRLRWRYALAKAGPLADFNAYAPQNQYVPGVAFIVAQESADSRLTSAIDAARTCSEQSINAVEVALASDVYYQTPRLTRRARPFHTRGGRVYPKVLLLIAKSKQKNRIIPPIIIMANPRPPFDVICAPLPVKPTL